MPRSFEATELSQFGIVIASYIGIGTLRLESGEELRCDFKAGQLGDGRIILVYQFNYRASQVLLSPLDVSQFEGMTAEGYQITASGSIGDMQSHRKINVNEPLVYATGVLVFRELIVHFIEGETNPSLVYYGVTNFEFLGTHPLAGQRVLPLQLPLNGEEWQATVIPVSDYASKLNHLKSWRVTDVTCEVVIDKPENTDSDSLMNKLCLLMSVASGTLIQWIYLRQCDEHGNTITIKHCQHVTRPYSPFKLINPMEGGGIDTKIFLEQGWLQYHSNEQWFNDSNYAILSYIEAKVDTVFLETRGIILAIAMESLKDVLLRRDPPYANEFVIPHECFDTLVPELVDACREIMSRRDINADDIQAVCNVMKIRGINRRSFRSILTKLFREIDLSVRNDDLRLFITCRDSLVHCGQFYYTTASQEQRDECPTLNGIVEEYLFLMHFLDRTFLKLFGYTGRYEDWSTAAVDGPTTRLTV